MVVVRTRTEVAAVRRMLWLKSSWSSFLMSSPCLVSRSLRCGSHCVFSTQASGTFSPFPYGREIAESAHGPWADHAPNAHGPWADRAPNVHGPWADRASNVHDHDHAKPARKSVGHDLDHSFCLCLGLCRGPCLYFCCACWLSLSLSLSWPWPSQRRTVPWVWRGSFWRGCCCLPCSRASLCSRSYLLFAVQHVLSFRGPCALFALGRVCFSSPSSLRPFSCRCFDLGLPLPLALPCTLPVSLCPCPSWRQLICWLPCSRVLLGGPSYIQDISGPEPSRLQRWVSYTSCRGKV